MRARALTRDARRGARPISRARPPCSRLHGNSFRGGIPTQLGRLSALQSLSLASNSLTGAIPSEWAKLTALTRLSAAWNQLGGTVPAEVWSNWPALRTLELQGNQLSGILPEEIENVDKLEELYARLHVTHRACGPLRATRRRAPRPRRSLRSNVVCSPLAQRHR